GELGATASKRSRQAQADFIVAIALTIDMRAALAEGVIDPSLQIGIDEIGQPPAERVQVVVAADAFEVLAMKRAMSTGDEILQKLVINAQIDAGGDYSRRALNIGFVNGAADICCDGGQIVRVPGRLQPESEPISGGKARIFIILLEI